MNSNETMLETVKNRFEEFKKMPRYDSVAFQIAAEYDRTIPALLSQIEFQKSLIGSFCNDLSEAEITLTRVGVKMVDEHGKHQTVDGGIRELQARIQAKDAALSKAESSLSTLFTFHRHSPAWNLVNTTETLEEIRKALTNEKDKK